MDHSVYPWGVGISLWGPHLQLSALWGSECQRSEFCLPVPYVAAPGDESSFLPSPSLLRCVFPNAPFPQASLLCREILGGLVGEWFIPGILPDICLLGNSMTSSYKSHTRGIKRNFVSKWLFSGLEENSKESNSKITSQCQFLGSFLELRFMSSFLYKPLSFPSVVMWLSAGSRENSKDKYCFRTYELSL